MNHSWATQVAYHVDVGPTDCHAWYEYLTGIQI